MTQLQTTLRQLRVSGLMQTLERPITGSRRRSWLGHGEFLELIVQDELNVRHQRMLARRTQGRRVPRTQNARRLRLAVQPVH